MPGRPENFDERAAERKALTRADDAKRDTALLDPTQEASLQRVRGDLPGVEEEAGGKLLEHCREAANVVFVGMGRNHQVKARDAQGAQSGREMH